MQKLNFSKPNKDTMWRLTHKQVMLDVLKYIFGCSNNFVLKGGTSLMFYYGLTRFSEDIDLDGEEVDIIPILQEYANKHTGVSVNVNKDTKIVKRCMIHYGKDTSDVLKVEVSYRSMLNEESYTMQDDGVQVYKVSALAVMKSTAYAQRDKIRDLYDICFLVNKFNKEISSEAKMAIAESFARKGFEQFDYLVATQSDELIDVKELQDMFLQTWETLGLPL